MDDSFGILVQRFGYLAIGVGTFIEGETVLILTSLLAVQGNLQLGWIIMAAALGAFAGDILAYYLGVFNASFLFRFFPAIRKFYPKAQHYLTKHGSVSVFIARFLYGLRVPTGVVCGITRMKINKFAVITLFGCSVWAALWCTLGYSFGHSLHALIEDIQQYEKYIFIAVLAILVVISIIRKFRSQARNKNETIPVIQPPVVESE